ncbi:MAG: DUF1800 domain-containing protein [Terriglobales bacterium]
MIPRRRPIFLLVVSLGLVVTVQLAVARKKDKSKPAPTQMAEQKRALHALNRLTFGPRPGDLQRVMAMGVDKWIAQQLHPEKIDDSALDARLAPLRTLRMNPREIAENFPPPAVIKAIADGKRGLPSDQLKHAVYAAQVERYEENQERKRESAAGSNSPVDTTSDPVEMSKKESLRNQEDKKLLNDQVREYLDMPPDRRAEAVLQMSPSEQQRLLLSLQGKREQFLEGISPRQRETIMALINPGHVVVEELVEGKLLRATYSQRQLQEVMADFWFNHFNVFINKGLGHFVLSSYERDVIRPHALGKFEDLLVATAQSPAMLSYLDNRLSVGPNSDVANGIGARGNDWKRRAKTSGPVTQSKGKRNGLNENYSRELMELHTLGVNGGYTQQDVTEVASVFTGWTVQQLQAGGAFTFNERMHEPGDKTVLGHRIRASGEREGREVLHLLAHNPSTAKFICGKLAVRFVSDNPPPALVDRMAQTFLKKEGNIREVLQTMFKSPAFWTEDAYRAKVKTPLEFVVSALRASGAEVNDALPVANQLGNMGMPLYGMQPPTGYPMKADAWVNSSALLERMNFALALSAGRLRGTRVDVNTPLAEERTAAAASVPGPEQILAALEDSLLAGDVSKQTHDTIVARLEDPQISRRKLDDPARSPNVAVIEGLLLGSPEFQRR